MIENKHLVVLGGPVPLGTDPDSIGLGCKIVRPQATALESVAEAVTWEEPEEREDCDMAEEVNAPNSPELTWEDLKVPDMEEVSLLEKKIEDSEIDLVKKVELEPLVDVGPETGEDSDDFELV